MEQNLIILIFLAVIFVTIYKPEISFPIILNINIFRAIPYVNYLDPRYGYYNENDVLLGAILPILCFLIITIKVFKKKKILYKVDNFDFFMIALSLIMLLSLLISPKISLSFNYFGIFIFLAAPFYFVTKLYLSNVEDRYKSLKIIITSIVFFAIVFSIVTLYLYNIAKYPYVRMTFPGVYPIPFCLFLSLSLLIFIIYYLKPKMKVGFSRRTKLLFSIPIFAIIIFSIIKTNTRGPVFSVLLTFVLLAFIFLKIKFNFKIILVSFFTLLAGAVVLFIFFDINDIASRFINLMPENKNADSISSRIDTYIDSIRIFINKPFGISVGTFKEYLLGLDLNHRIDPYSHNLFLELLSSFGIFGLLLGLLLIFLCFNEFKFLVKNQKKIFSDPYFF